MFGFPVGLPLVPDIMMTMTLINNTLKHILCARYYSKPILAYLHMLTNLIAMTTDKVGTVIIPIL